MFQALPFVEPATGLVYARARWYDPSTGSFLSPDPLGYRDSSNLYAFGAGDPVNNRDPLGEGILDDIRFAAKQKYTDIATHVAVTGKTLKGIGTSVVKTVVGVAAAANLIHEASKVGNVQAQLQLVSTAVQTRDAVAQWGTSAGQAIAEPGLIREAVTELPADVFAEEISDATILTASFIAPAAKAKAPAVTAPRFRINLASTGTKVRAPVNANITVAPAVGVTPRPPGRPSWRRSEVNAADELAGFDFVEQRSYLNGAEVSYGTPGSVRPDLTSDALRITVDVKNYNLATAQGRYSLVQNVIDQASARSTHLPPGYRQGLVLDVRGQTVNGRLLDAMVNRIVRKSGGTIRSDNVYFVGLD